MRLAAALILTLTAIGASAEPDPRQLRSGCCIDVDSTVAHRQTEGSNWSAESDSGNEAGWDIFEPFPTHFRPRAETEDVQTFGPEREPVGPGYGRVIEYQDGSDLFLR